MQERSFSGEVSFCREEGGWLIVPVPQSCIPPKELVTGHFGFVPITAKIATSEWDTSFLPAGDGTYFLALPKKIRTKQHIDLGDEVSIKFCLRNRSVK